MGWLVGDADGLWLGCDVGLNVAGVVGLAVKVVGLDVTGLAEGDTLGPTVGFKLGDDVGLVLGLPVTGFAVGDEAGTHVSPLQLPLSHSASVLQASPEAIATQT